MRRRARLAGALALGVYCLFQLGAAAALSRYGGNVLWHEQGMRFSWRVMVREKNGSVTFVVHNTRARPHAGT